MTRHAEHAILVAMPIYIALLRGVNVGGNRKLPMAELRDALAGYGYANPRTLLASGNLVFESKATKPAALEEKLEKDLKKAFGMTTDVMVRDPAEWRRIIADNPFPEQAKSEPSRLLVTVFKDLPSASATKALLESYRGPELIEVRGREVYVHYGAGMADTKLSLAKLGSGTARNWNTVLKLEAMLEE